MVPIDKLKALPTDSLRALNAAIIDELKARRYVESVAASRTLAVGQQAWFKHTKTGEVHTGRITEIKRTRATLAVPGQLRSWTVPMNMLRPAA